jgi:hypothetical protein
VCQQRGRALRQHLSTDRAARARGSVVGACQRRVREIDEEKDRKQPREENTPVPNHERTLPPLEAVRLDDLNAIQRPICFAPTGLRMAGSGDGFVAQPA